MKQGVALTGRNRTGPPCSVGRPTAHAPGPAAANCPRARHARLSAALQMTIDDDDKRQTTTTDASEQNNTCPSGGPVINLSFSSFEFQKLMSYPYFDTIMMQSDNF